MLQDMLKLKWFLVLDRTHTHQQQVCHRSLEHISSPVYQQSKASAKPALVPLHLIISMAGHKNIKDSKMIL